MKVNFKCNNCGKDMCNIIRDSDILPIGCISGCNHYSANWVRMDLEIPCCKHLERSICGITYDDKCIFSEKDTWYYGSVFCRYYDAKDSKPVENYNNMKSGGNE